MIPPTISHHHTNTPHSLPVTGSSLPYSTPHPRKRHPPQPQNKDPHPNIPTTHFPTNYSNPTNPILPTNQMLTIPSNKLNIPLFHNHNSRFPSYFAVAHSREKQEQRKSKCNAMQRNIKAGATQHKSKCNAIQKQVQHNGMQLNG